MKKIIVLLLCVMAYSTSFAQTDEKKAGFQLSFVPPLSTNGAEASQYTNMFSINILAGVSKNEETCTLGGLSNFILNNSKGLQMAGLSNYVGNDGLGLQMAGLININMKNFTGFQMGGLVNTAAEMNGIQYAGLLNNAQNMGGLQFSGLVNIAKNVNGLQFAGLLNIAKEVEGMQIAGLVNIADKSDYPIGVVNIIKEGEMGVAVTYDALGSTVATFRSGGKCTYGFIGIGYNHKTENSAWVSEGGIGLHAPITSWFRLNNELKAGTIGCDEDDPVLYAGYSLLPSFKLGKHFEVFGGVNINYMYTEDVSNCEIFPEHSIWDKVEATKLQQVFFGYQVGLQYNF